jgi:MFS-type transporter involved in bile tolerance (Atg22 family)
MKSELNRLRIIFLVIFLVATLILSVSVLVFSPALSDESLGLDSAALTMIGSAATSMIALLGFILTTVLSVRREKRETREFELALKQKEIELERARLELEQLKKQLEK